MARFLQVAPSLGGPEASDFCHRVNVDGTRNVLRAAYNAGAHVKVLRHALVSCDCHEEYVMEGCVKTNRSRKSSSATSYLGSFEKHRCWRDAKRSRKGGGTRSEMGTCEEE